MASAPVDEMPLLCELGWHKADPLARWNAGYYFTTCGRCGQGLVRTAYGGWRVPKGFKIVWQSKPPEGATAAELVPEQETGHLNDDELEAAVPNAGGLNDDQMELPIQEVLRHMETEERGQAAELGRPDFYAEEPAFAAPPADHEPVEEYAEPEWEPERPLHQDPDWYDEPEPQSRPRAEPVAAPASTAAIDDFMEDDWFMKDEPGYDSWDRAAQYQVDTAEPVIVDDETERLGNRSGKIRYGKEVDAVAPEAPASFLSMLRRPHESIEAEYEDAGDEDPAPAVAAPAPATRSGPHIGVVATLVGTFGVLLLLIAAVGGGWEDRQGAASMPAPSAAQAAPAAIPAPPREVAAAALSRAEETGFVTASLLNCRTAPAEQAQPVRILPRGEPVRVLALEPAWASISHRGRQCWASTRYLSAQQPL